MKPYEIATKIFYGTYHNIGNDVSYRIEDIDDETWIFFQGTVSKRDITLDALFFPQMFYLYYLL